MATQYKPNPTRAESREEAKKEEVAPPRGKIKPTEIFKEGVKPPVDDDMGSAQPGQPGQPAKKKAKGGAVKKMAFGGPTQMSVAPSARRTMGTPAPVNAPYQDNRRSRMPPPGMGKLPPPGMNAPPPGSGMPISSFRPPGGALAAPPIGPQAPQKLDPRYMKKGGAVKSASARADGCAIRGKTRA